MSLCDRDRSGRFAPGTTAGASTRFTEGNAAALVHGGRSRLVVQHPAAVAAMAARREALREHLGGFSVVQADLVDDYVMLDVLISTITDNLMAHGALSARGRTRAATNLLLQLLDRRLRYAERLGLHPAARPVNNIAEAFARMREEQRP